MKRAGIMGAMFALGALLVPACGDDGDDGGSTSASVRDAGSFNDADVEFAQGMIAHHEQAIAMAEMALDPKVGARPEVVDLARRIQSAQDPEIAQMTSWLTAWGEPMEMDTSGGHDMESMDGMMTGEEMDELATMTGAKFDAMWLDMMIRHHSGAIEQARDVKEDGSNADVMKLADAIITAQQREIDEMKPLLSKTR